MPSRDIFWIGHFVDDTFHPETTLAQPYIKRVSDNTTYPAVHIGNGGYEVKNILNGNYLFYDGETLKTNVLGNGSGGYRHYFDGNVNGAEITAGTINKDRLPNDIPQSKVSGLVTDLNNLNSSLTSGLAGKANLAGSNNFTGAIDFSADTTFHAPLIADYADYETDETGYHFVTNTRMTSYVAAQLVNFNPNVDSPNRIRVSGGVLDITGKIYNTIKKGTTYLTGAGASDSKVCTVEVIGMGTVAPPRDFLTADSPSFVNNVNVITEGQHIKILVKDVNINAKMTIENATLILGGDVLGGGSASDRIFQFMKLKNCKIYHFRNLTIKGGEVNGCTFIAAAGKKVTFDKDAANSYCDVINSVFNTEPLFTGGDIYGAAADAKVITALKTISDPTSGIIVEE